MAMLGAAPITLEKEQARIEGMRARNAARVPRFLNARQRTIGVDLEALDEQVRQRQAQLERERLQQMEEFGEGQAIRQLMEDREAEENALRREEADILKEEWQKDVALKEEMRRKDREMRMAPVDVDRTGVAALQKFKGEDPDRKARHAQQKAQMSQWSLSQMAHMEDRDREEKAEDRAYQAYLQQVAAVQTEIEEEEDAQRRDLQQSVRSVNERRALDKAEEHRKWKEDEARMDEEELAYRAHMQSEVKGGVKDQFRGLTEEQQREYLMSNEALKEQHQDALYRERMEDKAWACEQERVRHLLDETEASHQAQMKALESETLETLERQRREDTARRMAERQDRFGGISMQDGIYAGFGKSCR